MRQQVNVMRTGRIREDKWQQQAPCKPDAHGKREHSHREARRRDALSNVVIEIDLNAALPLLESTAAAQVQDLYWNLYCIHLHDDLQ